MLRPLKNAMNLSTGRSPRFVISVLALLGAVAGAQVWAAETAVPSASVAQQADQIVLTSGRLALTIKTGAGINPCSLRDTETERVYADRDYLWPQGALPSLEAKPSVIQGPEGGITVRLRGKSGALVIEQTFTAPASQPNVILEQITIHNPTDKPLRSADFRCGFAKALREGEAWLADAEAFRLCPVPYRRETDGQMQEFPLREVAEHGTAFGGWFVPPIPTPIWGAEGWVWSSEASAFLVAKYNGEGMEWSLMEPAQRGTETQLRFGGAGQWKHGHPEKATQLEPGQSYTFGETRFQIVDGDWRQAYYAYRGYIEGKGCRRPNDYNPPVQWNELYDNEYFSKLPEPLNKYFFQSKRYFCPEFVAENNKLLNEYYTLELMKAEAAKAQDLGCEALYLDPGWDTGLAHHIWDVARLGSMESFVKMIREEYGMKGVSLWCSLAGVPPTIGDPAACPLEARVLTKDGQKADLLVCFASPGFLDTKEKRLLELCRNGALFLMFDSDQYTGPCYDTTHGHAIPSTREEHAQAIFELIRRIKKQYPQVLIELHDPVTGPSNIHYTPTYYGYAPPSSFDCLWGHEFMWSSLEDILSGRARSLYYYNLAYGVPLYLHVSLGQDNEQALVFWWYASTCRHLGVGGKPASDAVWAADRRAMKTYLSLKPFFTQGDFYGLEETVHAHTLPERHESVLNLFNLEEQAVEKHLSFALAEIGLPSGSAEIEGAAFRQDGDTISLDVTVPARGHQLIQVRGKTPGK